MAMHRVAGPVLPAAIDTGSAKAIRIVSADFPSSLFLTRHRLEHNDAY
jgi:hypothetical protein